MTAALVLNATYEPLGVVSSRRALVLCLAGKAECEVGSGDLARSEHLRLEYPTVVRLRRYVQVPYRRQVALNRRTVFARDGGRCQYCGASAESIDHVVPRAKGGTHEWTNVVAACRPCNVTKRDRLLRDTAMELRRRPRAPLPTSWITLSVGCVPSAWRPYLGDDTALTA